MNPGKDSSNSGGNNLRKNRSMRAGGEPRQGRADDGLEAVMGGERSMRAGGEPRQGHAEISESCGILNHTLNEGRG